jgi:hypothetical protein
MLQTLDSEIRECSRHAQCNRRADRSRDSVTKLDFLDMERRWLSLAHSYEFAERLSISASPPDDETGKKPRKRRSPDPLVPIRISRSRPIMGRPRKEYEHAELVRNPQQCA